MIEADGLKTCNGIRHGFFTRRGGASCGIYASLNTGLGSDDDRQTVLSNRAQVRERLAANFLLTPYQIHSARAVVVNEPWDEGASPPKADALVTARPGIAIAINTADCTPVLFADPEAGIIGAAHAGWQGAVSGVLEATVSAMEGEGARRGAIRAAIGPTISQANYEVGPEFHARFVERDADHDRFFIPSERDSHFMFDLPGFVRTSLDASGIAQKEDVGMCTYAGEEDFFSYRRTTHRGEPDYGRQMSAIVITQQGMNEWHCTSN